MSAEGSHKANRRVAIMLVAVAGLMVGFSFALVPLYNVFCEITGLNGKTGRIETEQALDASVDSARTVTVELDASVNENLPWKFGPAVRVVKVHPGEIGKAVYYAENVSERTIVGQAVPSVAPAQASKYFNKTECFCFTQQTMRPGERREMPLRFVVDPNLPGRIKTITLSYTFFDTQQKPAGQTASRNGSGAAPRL